MSEERMTPEQYKQEELELFDKYNIPEELRGTLSYMAYERSHSAGYEEVINTLNETVYNLAKPIQDLIKHVKENA